MDRATARSFCAAVSGRHAWATRAERRAERRGGRKTGAPPRHASSTAGLCPGTPDASKSVSEVRLESGPEGSCVLVLAAAPPSKPWSFWTSDACMGLGFARSLMSLGQLLRLPRLLRLLFLAPPLLTAPTSPAASRPLHGHTGRRQEVYGRHASRQGGGVAQASALPKSPL